MIIVSTHSGADFDALASLMLAKKIYPEALLFLPPSPEKRVREYIGKVGFPGILSDKETLQDEKADILVLVDTGSIRRATGSGFFLKPQTEIHIYDHHPRSATDSEASVEIRKETGSTATILSELVREKRIRLTPEEATLAAIGVSEDTGNLKFPITTRKDRDIFRYLLRSGADPAIIAEYTMNSLDKEHKKLLNKLLKSRKEIMTPYGSVIILSAVIERYIEDLSSSVHKAVEILNPEILISLIQAEDKSLCIIRSGSAKFDAGRFLTELGGGGHPTAASLSTSDTLDELKRLIIRKLNTHPKEVPGILIRAARIIPSKNTVSEAYRTMLHLNIRRAPVGDSSGLLKGIAERRELRKAVRHNLGESPVTEFLSGRIPEASDKLKKEELSKRIASEGYGFLVLKRGGEVTGIAEKSRSSGRKISPATDHAIVSEKMNKTFDEYTLAILKKVSILADEMGLEAYCIGGMVRDLLMGIPHKDIDIAVSSEGIEFARRLAARFGARAASHKKFNTAVIKMADRDIDVATLRNEYYEFPGALPDVSAGDISQDLYRRDFSINSMAVRLNPQEKYGELIDPFGGRDDLVAGRISILYPLSFIEDPTRILRGARFEKRFNFSFSQDTLTAVSKAISEAGRFSISPYRLKEELIMTLKEDNPAAVFRRVEELGALRFFNPRLRLSNPVLSSLSEYPPRGTPEILKKESEKYRVEALLIVLLSALSEEKGAEFIWDYNFKRELMDKYIIFRRNRERVMRILGNRQRDARIYKTLHNFSPDLIYAFILLSEGVRRRENAFRYMSTLRYIYPSLRGGDLVRMNIPPGPLFSEILFRLKLLKINNPVITASEEESYIISNYIIDNPPENQ